MRRLRQFSVGLGSSWIATLATVVYSLLSVPISLQYLSVEEFGLFVLLLQAAAYFTLLELGMSAATARILVDYKDQPDSGVYGSVILTGLIVFVLQGSAILVAGVLAAPLVIQAIGVPEAFAGVAVFLLRWLAVSTAVGMVFKIFGSVLYANKRLDLIHAFAGFGMLLGLVLLFIILSSGAGLRGLIWLFLIQAAVSSVLPIVACYRLGLLPMKGRWGRPTWAMFRELFGFGKDVFLVNIGNQVLEASQLIIVTRTMGLTAAAIWSVSTKLFALVYQLVNKIEGTAVVFFAEMIVRGEKAKLRTRFRQVYQLTAGFAGVAIAFVATINAQFVSVWAEPDLAWPLPLSFIAGLLVFLNAITRCSGDLIVHTKLIASFRYVYLAEAVCFVALASWLGPIIGFYGILAASILCLFAFRGAYTTWRISRYFKLPAKVFWWTWLKQSIFACLLLLPFVVSAGWLANSTLHEWTQLLIATTWVSVPAVVVFFYIAMPRDIREEFAGCWKQIGSASKH